MHVQESTSATDTIEAKRRFEQFCQDRGVHIRHYHADNGIFASKGFREEVRQCGQTLSFCGVGAHHQNGVAERRIQDLADSARASLAHAAHHNPAITANLWPYALRHASYVRRIMPREHHSKSPEELFTGSKVRPTTKFLHAFGCPVYVLQEALQSGNSIPKWNERSRVGVYLGHSSQHAQNVSLILNPRTGYLSPQFHCVYDDQFDSSKSDANFNKLWAEKAGFQENVSTSDEHLPYRDYLKTSIPHTIQTPFDVQEQEPDEEENFLINNGDNEIEETGEFERNMPQQPEGAQAEEQINENTIPPSTLTRTTRSGRTIRLTKRLQESSILPRLQSFVSIADHIVNVVTRLDDNSINELCKIVAYPASISDQDTMYLSEALRQDDRDEFL